MFDPVVPDRARTTRRRAGVEVSEIEMPHIVVTRVHGTVAAYSGPYPAGLAALVAAEFEHVSDRESGGEGDLTFHVTPLHPATPV